MSMKKEMIFIGAVVVLALGWFTFTKLFSAPTMNYTQAILHTNLGDITIELLAAEAPKTVANFTKLAGAGGTKGTTDVAVADELLAKIDEIAVIFWETKKA